MENLSIQINTGIKSVDITNERGEVVFTLRINTADTKTAERYLTVIDNLSNASDDYEAEAKAVGAIEDKKERTIGQARLHVSLMERCIKELDDIFGEGCIRGVYRECYELNENFIPDEAMLLDFLESIMPVMNKLFNERFEATRKKYNASRKGGKR